MNNESDNLTFDTHFAATHMHILWHMSHKVVVLYIHAVTETEQFYLLYYRYGMQVFE